jgi:hypothetical protein
VAFVPAVAFHPAPVHGVRIVAGVSTVVRRRAVAAMLAMGGMVCMGIHGTTPGTGRRRFGELGVFRVPRLCGRIIDRVGRFAVVVTMVVAVMMAVATRIRVRHQRLRESGPSRAVPAPTAS